MIVDLSDPTRALTPTLDGPVLSVLARAGHPLTVGEIAQQAARGSEIGIRRSVARLVEQGLVTATQMGRNLVHELNRDHVAAPAAALLADLRLELWKRLRETLSGWAEKPVHAAVFGSAARGDGGPDSDIDLLARPQALPGRRNAPGENAGMDRGSSEALVAAVDRLAQPLTPLRSLTQRPGMLRSMPSIEVCSAGRGTPCTRSNCRPGSGSSCRPATRRWTTTYAATA